MTDRPSYPVDDDDDFGGAITPPRRAADKDLDPVGQIATPALTVDTVRFASDTRPSSLPAPTAPPSDVFLEQAGEQPRGSQQAPVAFTAPQQPELPAQSATFAEPPTARLARRGPRARDEITHPLSTRLEIGVREHLVRISEGQGMTIREVLEVLIETYGDLVKPRS